MALRVIDFAAGRSEAESFARYPKLSASRAADGQAIRWIRPRCQIDPMTEGVTNYSYGSDTPSNYHPHEQAGAEAGLRRPNHVEVACGVKLSCMGVTDYIQESGLSRAGDFGAMGD